MSDDTQIMHDLLATAINNKCYIAWVAAGTTLGSLAKPGFGTLIGFAGGLLWASYTCKPIAENVADRQRFLSESDFQSFHKKINAYFPVTRDEAFALAALAAVESPGQSTCSAPPNVSAQFKNLFSVGRA